MNWYAYVNNDPVNFIDPNGLFTIGPVIKITEWVITFLTTGESLGANHTGPNTSLYQQQYTSVSEDYAHSATIAGIASVVAPEPYALMFAGISLVLSFSEGSDIIVTDPASFVAGAEKEIQRIDAAIDCLSGDPTNNDFINFLQQQKDKLEVEKKSNMEKLNNMGFTTIVDGDLDPNELSNPLEGINYEDAYKESKLNGCKMDE